MNIKEKYKKFRVDFEDVCRKVKRNPASIKVLYAVKYLDTDGLREFLKILAEEKHGGIIYIGENRVQEGEKKIGVIKEFRKNGKLDIKYSMIGPLQKNKINKALEIFDEIYAIDSIDIAIGISKRLKKGATMPVMIEVNISQEVAKHGFNFQDVDRAIVEIRKLNNLNLSGLLTMAPFTKDEAKIRPVFNKLRQLADNHKLTTSMGMSNDWKIAIEEGSDIIRVGGAVFGD